MVFIIKLSQTQIEFLGALFNYCLPNGFFGSKVVIDIAKGYIGFMSNVVAQATASYDRIANVLDAPKPTAGGTLVSDIRGDVAVAGLTVRFGEREALSDVSFTAKAGTRTAVIGPTAAGKTQLLYAITGLIVPHAGSVTYDGVPLEQYDRQSLHQQVGLCSRIA